MNELLTKRRAAELLGVSTRTIDRMRAEGRLRAVRPTGRRSVRFEMAELEKYVAKSREKV